MSGITTIFTSTHDVQLNGCDESIAAASDVKVPENMLPFVYCSHICSACKPQPFMDFTGDPWAKTVKSIEDSGERILTEESYFWCVTGAMAKVEFEDPGQETIYVGESGNACELTEEEAEILEELKDLAKEAKELWEDSDTGDFEGFAKTSLERGTRNQNRQGRYDMANRYNEIMGRVNEVMSDPGLSNSFKQMAAYEFTVNGGYDFDTSLAHFGHDHSGHALDLGQQDEVLALAYKYAVSQDDPAAIQTLINNVTETYDGIRNQLITAEYARMGLDLDDWLGGDAGANWALIASIASNSAGDAISGDIPPLFPLGLGTLTYDDREDFALGNIDIYNDVAAELYDLTEFVNGNNPDYTPNDDNLVQVGIGTLIAAATEPDLLTKQELVLLSTMQMLDHEQGVVIDDGLQDLFKELPWYGDLGNVLSYNTPFYTAMEQVKISWDGYENYFVNDDPIPTHGDMLVDYDNIQNPTLKEMLDNYRENAEPHRTFIPSPNPYGFGGGMWVEEDDYTDFNSRMNWVGNVMGHQGTHPGIITTNKDLLMETNPDDPLESKLAVVTGATLTCPKAVHPADVKFFNMKK